MIDSVLGIGIDAVPMRPTTPLSGAAGMAPAEGTDFASMLGNAMSEFGQKMRKSEAVSIGGINGTAPLQDVVEHVMSAEQSLQTAIAIRDKVVSAYQEISRMPI